MILKRLFILIIFIPYIAFANKYTSIKYDLSFNDIEKPLLKVSTTIKGDFSNQLILSLPFSFGGVFYVEQIKNIHILNHKFRFAKKKDANDIIIDIPNKENEITISYEIHQEAGDPSEVHGAIIRKDLIHFPGISVFAIPKDLKIEDVIDLDINFLNVDPKWKILTSHSINDSIHMKASYTQALYAIYAVGDIRRYKIGNDNSPIFLSLYGKFDSKDRKIIADVKNIMLSQRKFFNDYESKYYAISLIEGNVKGLMGGTALYNSFTGFIPHDSEGEDYTFLAHENLHNWIGGKIRNNKEEELNYWWTEGFTDFFSRIIAFRSGRIKESVFIKEVNEFLSNYYLSPVNKEPNSRIKKDYWNNYNIQKLPYYRGFVFAIYLNDLIKKNSSSNSLDDIMHDLLKSSPNPEFSTILFKNIAKKYIPDGIDNEISNFIDKGNIISIENVNLPIEKVMKQQFDLGFDKISFKKDHIIKDIDIKSNAYKAGLRNADRILSYDIPKGFDQNDQIITIKTSKGIFNFKPESGKKILVYQLKQKLSRKERKQLRSFFGA